MGTRAPPHSDAVHGEPPITEIYTGPGARNGKDDFEIDQRPAVFDGKVGLAAGIIQQGTQMHSRAWSGALKHCSNHDLRWCHSDTVKKEFSVFVAVFQR